MSIYSELVQCPNVQASINQLFLADPTQSREVESFLMFLTDPVNRSMLQGMTAIGDSRIRTVEAVWKQRYLETETSSSAINGCEGGEMGDEATEKYEIDPDFGTKIEFSIELSKLRKNCKTNAQWFAEEVQARIDQLIRGVAMRTSQELPALVGQFRDGTSAKDALTRDGNAFVNNALQLINRQYREINGWNRPFVFGAGLIADYFESVEFGCCADVLSIDLGEFVRRHNVGFMYDRRIPEQLSGDEGFVAVAPGALQLLYFNEYEGDRQVMDQPDFVQGTITDPLTQIPIDWWASFDRCGKWNFSLKLAHMLVGMPEHLYRANDPLSGVNYVLRFNATTE